MPAKSQHEHHRSEGAASSRPSRLAPDLKPAVETEPLSLLLQRAVGFPSSLTPAVASQLQRSIGNQAMGKLAGVQAEPTAGTKDQHSLQHMLDSQTQSRSGESSPAVETPASAGQVSLPRSGPDVFFRKGENGIEKRSAQGIRAQLLANRIQRKPANIDQTHELKYDVGNSLTNVGAARAKEGAATKINQNINQKWVEPEETLIGGHLFKREYGGPDDKTNVVPWTDDTEKAYTTFEDQYRQEADKQAPGTTEIHTEAKFVDRDDLKADDKDFNLPDWDKKEKELGERKDKFKEVAELFADIPDEVAVTATFPDKKTISFAKSKAGIAPAFTKSAEALKPGFKPTLPPFQLNPGKPIAFKEVADFNQHKPEPQAQYKKLQHIWNRHPADFGIEAKGSVKTRLAELQTAIKGHMNSKDTTQILGVYRNLTVLHYIDPNTLLWVCTKEDGSLVAGWKLGATQYDALINRGSVK